MSLPSAAIWNCRSGFGICLRHTTTFRATANARRKRTLFQASQRGIGEVDFGSVSGYQGTGGGEKSIVQSPWKSVGTPEVSREYLALLSYLLLKRYRKML